jgi:two-component system NarL family sensor kinase
LVSLGLIQAIKQEIIWLEKTGTYQISCNIPKTNLPRNQDKDLIIFRIIQELLQNIIKHANAKKICISLRSNLDKMRLIITDDGIGFSQTQTATSLGGMGLANIQKRTALLGGEMQITSAPDQGTTISITLSYASTDH